MSTKPRWTALILAAGKGTRMKSETPKVLHPLLGRPMLAWVLEAAAGAGVAEMVVVVGHGREQIEKALGPAWPSARWAIQAEQRGTGHAAACGRESLAGPDRPVLVLNGDAPLLTSATLESFLQAHETSRAAATLLSFRAADPAGYGRILRDPAGNLQRIVEERDATPTEQAIDEVNSGIYALGSHDLFAALEQLQPNNDQGEYYLTDIFEVLVRQGKPVRVHLAGDPNQFRGINHRAELAEICAILRARKNRELMLAGVTLEDPACTYVDAQVRIGPDTVLEPGVRLEGGTTIGTGCRIAAGSVVRDSELADGATVKPYSVLDRAKVGPAASVGPFAHLRPGSDLGPHSKVGNFVEVKNARLGEHAKASHLTYLGDANIGRDVNVGAGTITCNYDGFAKHHTEIG